MAEYIINPELLKRGSWTTLIIFGIALIIFGAPFLLISVWDSVEHEHPYLVTKIIPNDNMETCDLNELTILIEPNTRNKITKCGRIGELNEIVFLLESQQRDDN